MLDCPNSEVPFKKKRQGAISKDVDPESLCCLLTWSWQMSRPHPHKPTGHQQTKGWQVDPVQLDAGS